MGSSIREIVNAAQKIVGEVSGPSVQTYGEDSMMEAAIQVFNMLHKKYYWPQFLDWQQLTLDGITGRVTTVDAFNYVRDFEDVFKVWIAGDQRPLALLPLGTNPFTISGSRPRYYSAINANDAEFVGKRIRIWPAAAVGDIQVACRVYPINGDDLGENNAWTWDDIMELDFDMLVHGTAWRTLSNDDLNPSGAADQRGLMEGRFNDITKRYADMPIEVYSNGGVPMTWYTNP